ncbi:MAG: cysteine desulfurase NifS, partial [Candidatus Saccharimonadales bacterium]
SLPNNVHVTIPGIDNERLLLRLDLLGVAAAGGSACSASREDSSHVLKAIGLSEELSRASLRFTAGRQTVPSDIDRAIKAVVAACGEQGVI